MLAGHLDRLDEISVNHSDDNSSNTGSGSRSHGFESSVSDSQATGNTPQTTEAEILATKVSKQLFWLKMTVLFVLVLAAVMVATAIYLTTQNSEIQSFETAFADDSAKVIDTFRFNIERKLGSVDAFSVAITSLAVDTQASWPNFTLPNFEYRAANARELADAEAISLLPYVTEADRPGWEAYAVDNYRWIEDSQEFEASIQRKLRDLEAPPMENGIHSEIYMLENDKRTVSTTDGPFFPFWQHYPVIPSLVNFDLWSNENFKSGIDAMVDSTNAVIGKIWDLSEIDDVFLSMTDAWELAEGQKIDDPIGMVFYPVFDTFAKDHSMVAMLSAVIHWKTYFEQILPPQVEGIVVVLENECDQVYTYQINGENAEFLGKGDLHDESYDYLGVTATFAELLDESSEEVKRFTEVKLNTDYCLYSISVYPSEQLESEFLSNNSIIYTVSVLVIFAFTGAVFLLYDFIVERRQQMVMKRAVQSRAIVSSLFPAAVRDRLFRADDSTNSKKGDGAKGFRKNDKSKLKNFLADSGAQEQKPAHELRPIADLFPHTTVMFADIAGFTRWSSERDPAHVFTLLQTVYHAFDRVAKKRGVFKVETIGDCYVAVTGLPDPQADHAVRMAKFANECKKKMTELVQKLKVTLGEDTAELCMRFGLHSGPVTAGVLRGEKSRFQLFGNTVNTAARMENSGQRNKIQVSQETADLITDAGKGHWIFQRIDDVAARGGIQTYWCEPQSNAEEAKLKNSLPTRVTAKPGAPVDNSQRLIDWNVDLLKKLLKRIVANRIDKHGVGGSVDFTVKSEDGTTVRDEVVEAIELPRYDKEKAKTDPQTIVLGEKVEQQLRDYVTIIESMYHDNPFHSFKHASNVCTSANKLLQNIVDEDLYQRTSDPLTQFGVVFSALIHDVDHAGLTNMLLMKEKPHIAALYRNQSVAEQNSVDLAWNLLMDPEYEDLQQTIFSTQPEFKRFRNLAVNVVMATDIFDKELNGDRNIRWEKAFHPEKRTDPLDADEESTLKATVIIEHVMQIADVMHTMQHFHSYQRWNERLFEEMYAAFESGKSNNDPSNNWYQGEIWFFDNCVIPLAQRIRDSGVFGVQGEDCLRNAISNKKEWAVKGGDIVKQQIEKIHKKADEENAADTEEKKTEAEEEKKADPDRHLIEWNVDLLKRMLRQILADRMARGVNSQQEMITMATSIKEGTHVRNEISRIIQFPLFDKKESKLKVDPETIELSDKVQEQLRDFIAFIASMYRDNEFHNFKHASNVAMAANKYMQRVANETLEKQVAEPLTRFAVIFAALIHDVDHSGVPNAQLVKEGARMAVVYNNKSVAEQNSFDMAWSVLMDSEYKDLQNAIYGDGKEMERFRKLVVNSVMATDLFDDELIADREKRWLEAFEPAHRDASLSDEDQQNLIATFVMELVLQASDIGHTMQHFHSFRRWNERLFFEMYAAFENGRLENDPSATWYQDEIAFFDKVVIPVAKKLKGSNLFGIAGEDALGCATANRKEWVVKGTEVVNELKKKYEEEKKEKKEKEEKEKK